MLAFESPFTGGCPGSTKIVISHQSSGHKVRNSKISALVHNTLFSCYMYISQNCHQMTDAVI
jgi:hypothetical protein